MKKIYLTCFFLIIVSLIPQSAWGIPSSTERKLNHLTNRFTSLEAAWGRFQMGGNFALETNAGFNKTPTNLGSPAINQQMGLSLDAFIDRNLQFSLRVSQQGGWGLNYQSIGINSNPMYSPFQVDEAFLKMAYPNSLNYLGRFRFSLGPLGLISDFYHNPIDGFAFQYSFQKFHVIGVYSRVYTAYKSGTNQVESAEDYGALRLGWSNPSTIIGLNVVPKGITGEKDLSLDWSFSSKTLKLSAELGWYTFDSNQYPDFNVQWVPGMIFSYGRALSKKDYLQLKAGYFAPRFTPSYSSLAHSSGEDREWFIPNSEGIELYLQNDLKNHFSLENRLILLVPIQNFNQPDYSYRWRSCITKNLSAVNQLQFGIDLRYFPDNVLHQLFAKWHIQF